MSHFRIKKKPFLAKGTITKEGKTYVCLGESSYKKKESKQNVVQKLLELLNEKYTFSEEKLPEIEQNPSENYSDKEKLYKWTYQIIAEGPKEIKMTKKSNKIHHSKSHIRLVFI